MRILLVFSILLMSQTFAQNNVYQKLQGKWSIPQADNEIDIVVDIAPSGTFTMYVKPAFEYTNLSISDQEKAIQSTISDQGYIKILRAFSPSSARSEILLNGEISTNTIEISSNQIFIIDAETQNKNLFLQR